MKILSLNGTWQLTGKPQCGGALLSLTATVPGCVQLDLSKAGFLPEDLFLGMNITQTEQFEDYEWWYETTFTAPEERENVFLVFEGVDCLAEYYLNQQKIGESRNMFIAHEFQVDAFLQPGENTLTVHLRSPIIEAESMPYDAKLLTQPRNLESRWIRKPPHSYGWDIMPRAVTSGLWREVRLEVRDPIRFTQSYITTTGTTGLFCYTLEAQHQDLNGIEVELSGSCGTESAFCHRVRCNKKFNSFYFSIPNPQRWWPYGYGDANVYDAVARIYRNGVLIHEKALSFGIRDVVLERKEAQHGPDGHFRILINGVEIMCKGSNWVPMDAFHSRDAQRYEQALALVTDIGCNILRCWGGNVYEDHAFFDYCDRHGIMIWQDFAMACNFYPEYEDFKENLREEATAVVRKLRNHPSIILWAGDNEVDSCSSLYDPNTNSINRTVLAKCVELNDPRRPYLPSSPYITPSEYAKGVRSQVLGSWLPEDHLWGPRDYFKGSFYRNNAASFVSETGYHGCPSLESIRKFITPEHVWPYHNNPEWILHSSDQTGNDGRVMLMEHQVRQLFGTVPTEPEDYIFASQISQAEAKKYFIERLRIHRPQKTGVIWWNLLDGWPQMSDAVVDYYFNKKAAYAFIKRSQAPFVIAADELDDWSMRIYACNDTLQVKEGTFTVTDAETEEVLLTGNFSAKANTSTLIGRIPLFYSEHKILIFRWNIGEESGMNHYLCGFPPINLEMYRKLYLKWGL